MLTWFLKHELNFNKMDSIIKRNKSNFIWLRNDKVLGNLSFSGNSNLEAQIKISDTELYEVKPYGWFGQKIKITKDSNTICELKSTFWQSKMIISFKKEKYILSSKGFFSNFFVLKDEKSEILFELRFSRNINNFKAVINHKNHNKEISDLVKMLAVYGAINITKSNYQS
jgi:hypothetical protein